MRLPWKPRQLAILRLARPIANLHAAYRMAWLQSAIPCGLQGSQNPGSFTPALTWAAGPAQAPA